MVWFHGGDFTTGAGSQYDPTRLVTQGNVIVVTINYRLGALGFLDLPALASHGGYAGDYALADQQAALRWVRRNAGAFGGDRGNVTIFGQSAGAFSVCANLAAPSSRGLFQKAIVQSGPCSNTFVTTAAAQHRDAQLVASLGCDTAPAVMACLRAKPASDFVALGGTADVQIEPLSAARWEFAVGGRMLPQQPIRALASGADARIPLILGSTHDEMTEAVAFTYNLRGDPVTGSNYVTILTQLFGSRAAAIAAEYPLTAYPSPFQALSAVLTDYGRLPIGACPMLPLDDTASRHAPVYAYEFAQNDGLQVDGLPLGAAHGSELPYLFDGTFDYSPPPPPNPVLAAQMITYWTRFARTGNPNGGTTPNWPLYRPGGRVLSLTVEPDQLSLTNFAASHHCSFWQEH
jgi:para-nitrobenzyl esterase